jgi:putative transcriptional regulator
LIPVPHERIVRYVQDIKGEAMKKLTKAILERDAKRDIGAEILEAVREIKAGGGRRFTVQVTEVTEARFKVGMSQPELAEMLGVSVRTLQDWEQGRRQPSGAAKALLRVAAKAPKALRAALRVASN